MNRIYLDNAASTPVLPGVRDFMIRALHEDLGNPSGIHGHGRAQRSKIESARATVASRLKASIGEIFFTSGGTESNNTILRCAQECLDIEHFVSSPTEHPCVINTLKYLQDKRGVKVTWLDVDRQGFPDLDHLKRVLQQSSAKTMVSLMHANNEMGTMIDLYEVGALCGAFGALFHTDTVQTVGHDRFDLESMNISFLSASAHKFHGPKGSGILYCNSDNLVESLLKGGAQERSMRAGTENVVNIAATAMALEHMEDHLEEYKAHVLGLRERLKSGIERIFPDAEFNGDQESRFLYTLLSVGFAPTPMTDMLIPLLDIEGISVSGSSACSSGAEQKSRIIEAIKPNSLQKTIRFSFSHDNTVEEIDQTLSVLERVLEK